MLQVLLVCRTTSLAAIGWTSCHPDTLRATAAHRRTGLHAYEILHTQVLVV
jgi:hypothetical protein